MARQQVGVPYENPVRYTGPHRDIIPIVKVSREPTSTDDRFPIGQFWLLGDNPTTGTVGDLYYLCDYVAGAPVWCKVSVGAGSSGIDGLVSDAGLPAAPADGAGNVTVAGGTGITTAGTGPGTTITFDLDIPVIVANGGTGATSLTDGGILIGSGTGAVTVTAQPANGELLIGRVGMDPVLNTLTAGAGITISEGSGTITIAIVGGGVPTDSITVDAVTGPGVNPVVPDGTGLMTVTGNAVAAHSVPIETHSRAINSYVVEVQYAAATATSTPTSSGVVNPSNTDFNVGSTGFLELKVPPPPSVGVTNLGINNDGGGVTKITSQDGTALSASNVAKITIPDKGNFGYFVTIDVTADQAFTDDVGTSQITGNLFGNVTGVAWANVMPFYIYAVVNDAQDAIAFMISRDPTATVSPAAANIGAPDDAVADAQADFWSFDNIDETLYESNPCICIGALRMTMSASDDWTVATLDDSDGIGQFHEQTLFTLPTGVNGAAAGTYILANAGTEPQWVTNGPVYYINRQGFVRFEFNSQNANVVGVGAQTLQFILPYRNASAHQQSAIFALFVDFGTSARFLSVSNILGGAISTNNTYLDLNGNAWTNAFVQSGDTIQFNAEYPAFPQ